MAEPDYQQALAHHQQGRLDEAAVLYQAILAADPAHFDALHLLGVIEAQRGDPQAASELMARALAIDQGHAVVHFNHGLALQALNRPVDALAGFDAALALQPEFAEALNSRAMALIALGRHAGALESADRALALEPRHAEALFHRGVALQALQHDAEALQSYEHALALQPGLAAARDNRDLLLARQKADEQEAAARFEQAVALHAQGRLEDAVASYDAALAAQPGFAEALGNRGLALQSLGRPVEALDSYDRAIIIKPDFAQAMSNRGLTLHVLRRHEEALASYGQALALDPRMAEAYYSRGAVLQFLGRWEEALASYDSALQIEPEFAGAVAQRADTLMSMQHYTEAALAYARLRQLAPGHAHVLGNQLHAELFTCDWRNYDVLKREVAAELNAGRPADMPFSFLSVSDSAAAQLRCARAYVANACPAAPEPLWRGEIYRHEKIRLAYVSADFREHAVSFLLAQLLETHDRKRFELTAISLRPAEASVTGLRVKTAFPQFIDVSAKSDLQIAALMRRLEIDIAVDLMGYTTGARRGIFWRRPAPLQVNYLGFAGTLGAEYMDYIIADPQLIPAAGLEHYAEQVAYLPDSFMPRDTDGPAGSAPAGRLEAGLPPRGFVFCSFNNAYKFNPPMFDVWMRLLQQVPGSVLWLPDHGAAATQNLLREAQARGVDAARIVFARRAARVEDHVSRLALADLFLDTLPYNAHTTAGDALWAGLPVLTCRGDTFAGRVAASLLTAAGLPELITDSLADYEAAAARLATHPATLNQMRKRLSKKRLSLPLFDAPRYRRHLEAAYVTMFQRYRQGLAPESFSVPPID